MTTLAIALLVLLAFSGSKKAVVPAEIKPRSTPGGGRVWVEPGDNPPNLDDFDDAGNGILVDPACTSVVEGRYFFPDDWDSGTHRREEAETLTGTLQIGSDNTAMGYLDYLVDTEGVTDPILISARILEEVAPSCAAVPDTSWGEAMTAWYSSLVDRVTAYVQQDTIG